MSYSEFNIDSLRKRFGLKFRDQPLFQQVGLMEVSSWLKESLAKGQDLAVLSEKARGEFIVAPILLFCRMLLGRDLRIFSGIRLDIDPERGLEGECDFILARTESRYFPQAPRMVLQVAKRGIIEEALGQCVAQMIGARLYSEKEGTAASVMYGCVTTGHIWLFLKLEGNELLIHPERLGIQELGKVLWFLVECLRDMDRVAIARCGTECVDGLRAYGSPR